MHGVEYAFERGDYSDWLTAGTELAWAITEPADYVDADELHNTPAVTAPGLDVADAFLFDDASVSSGSQLKEIAVSELDKRWGEAPLVASLPIPLVVGERFKLTATDTVIVPAEYGAITFQTDAREIPVNKSGFNGIYAYNAMHGTASLQGKVFVNMDSTATYRKLWLYTGTQPTVYDISLVGVPDNVRFHEVIGLLPSAIASGTTYKVEARESDGDYLEASRDYLPGDWTVTTTSTLTHTPGSPATWAEFGNTDVFPDVKYGVVPIAAIPQLTNAKLPDRIQQSKIPVPGLRYIADHIRGPGSTISSSPATVRSPETTLNGFDMSLVGNNQGLMGIELIFTLTNRLSNTVAFDQVANQDEASDHLTVRHFYEVDVATVLATPAYQASQLNGVVIAKQDVFNGANDIADITAYVGRTGQNRPVFYFIHDIEAGSESYTLSTQLFVSFLNSGTGQTGVPYTQHGTAYPFYSRIATAEITDASAFVANNGSTQSGTISNEDPEHIRVPQWEDASNFVCILYPSGELSEIADINKDTGLVREYISDMSKGSSSENIDVAWRNDTNYDIWCTPSAQSDSTPWSGRKLRLR